MNHRWLARLSFVLMLAAAAVLIGFAGLRSLALVGAGVLGVCAVVAGAYWFLANRGVVRWLAAALVILVPVAIIVVYVLDHLLWVAVLAPALGVLAVVTARASLRTGGGDTAMPAYPAAPPRRAFIVMNPRSGGGKVAKFGLQEKAEALGARVALLQGPGVVDVAALARKAVADGCDLLGVAGGDGTQALVAGIAAEHDLPFLVISAGTRNHFALDLGLDRENPAACLDALTDGVELRIDLGIIGDRTFVNNASFGAYAEVVRSPAYRDDKRGTTLRMLPDLLKGHGGATLTARVGDVTISGPQALLVSNNPYETGDIAGLGQRARLDTGTLGVVSIEVDSARQAVALINRRHEHGLTAFTGEEAVVDSDEPEIPVGIDGETVLMRAPVRCASRPGALRVLVPKDRPGVRVPPPALDWARLRQLASFRPLAGPDAAREPLADAAREPAADAAPEPPADAAPEPPADAAPEPPADAAGAVAQSPADWLAHRDGPVRQRVGAGLRQLEAVDRAIYATVAATPTPSLDEPLRRLSNAANNSRLWLAIAAGLAVAGGRPGRRAAVRGTLAIGVTSALVNLGVKPVWARRRPDRAGAGVPGQRDVRMPASTSFPSGHAASGFAFATAIGREQPWLGLTLRFLAAAVAYSRVHTGVHYPGDAVVGSLIGAGAGQAVASMADRLPPARLRCRSRPDGAVRATAETGADR